MHSLPMLSCHRLRADVMAPEKRGGCAAHHQPAMARQRTWAIALAKSAITNCRQSDHFRAPVSYRADGVFRAWLVTRPGWLCPQGRRPPLLFRSETLAAEFLPTMRLVLITRFAAVGGAELQVLRVGRPWWPGGPVRGAGRSRWAARSERRGVGSPAALPVGLSGGGLVAVGSAEGAADCVAGQRSVAG
jgi:hypothetical protein